MVNASQAARMFGRSFAQKTGKIPTGKHTLAYLFNKRKVCVGSHVHIRNLVKMAARSADYFLNDNQFLLACKLEKQLKKSHKILFLK